MSFVMLVGMSAYFWHFYKLKKKNGDSYKIPIKDILGVASLFLLSGSLFIYSLLDLPNVLADKTKQYKGDCEIVIFDITRGGHTEANFGKHSIIFPKNYQGVGEGNYYCEVDFYPRTDQGKSLRVYQSKGGN
ncbi:hypothetical protein ACXM0N_13820 [Peribacillus simplex]